MKRIVVLIIMVIMAVSMVIPSGIVSAEDGYFHNNPCYMYVGKWVLETINYPPVGEKPGGSFSRWTMPEGAISALDLRSIPELDIKSPAGYGIFFCTKEISTNGYYFLGIDFNADIPIVAKSFMVNKWGISLEAYTNNGTIWEMFVEEGDPTGELRWKPLQPRSDGVLEIIINGFSPVLFAKDPPREHLGYGWYWKGKWEKRWDWIHHHWIKHWSYFRFR